MANSVKQYFQQRFKETNFKTAMSLGLIPEFTAISKFGYTDDIDAEGDVWPPATLYTFPDDAGETLTIVSTGLTDTQTIRIIGLDADGNEQIEEVVLTADTAAAVPGTWRAVNRAYNISDTGFTGEVTIQGDGSASSNVFAYLPAKDQQTVQMMYMVPADKVAVIYDVAAGVNKASGSDVACEFRLFTRKQGQVFRTNIRYDLQRNGTSATVGAFEFPIPAPPLAQIRVGATPTAAMGASAAMAIGLIDTDMLTAEALSAIEDS